MKVLNSVAQPVGGVTNAVLKVENWQHLNEFRVVAMNDFDIILGIDFFVKAQIAMMPYISRIMVSNATNPDFVHYTLVGRDCAVQGKDEKQFISML